VQAVRSQEPARARAGARGGRVGGAHPGGRMSYCGSLRADHSIKSKILRVPVARLLEYA
jgi:hypothetical protein